MIHFKDSSEVLNILRDMVTYMCSQCDDDKLRNKLLTRSLRVIEDNDNINVGDINEDTKQASKKDSSK